MGYDIEGRLLEVCTCNVLCPCWVGEDPDYKTCDTTIAWGIEKGAIDGVDVDGLTLAVSAHIPKNILDPEVVEGRRVRRRARHAPSRRAPCCKLFTGQLGGAVADLAGLIGEVVAVERDADHLHRRRRQGQPAIGSLVEAEMAPFVGRHRQPDDAGRDGLQHDPGLAGVRRQGEQVHARRERPRHPERGPRGTQRPPGPLPLRRLTATAVAGASRCSPPRTFASRGATGRSWPASLVALVAPRLGRALAVGGLVRTGPTSGTPAAPGRCRSRRRCSASAGSLMIVAMMLPSSIPLVMTFRALVAASAAAGDARRCCSLLGYLVVVVAFGLAAWLLDRLVHAGVEAIPVLAAHPELILASTLLVAGLWQFSPIRDRCLDECRQPAGVRHEPLARRRRAARVAGDGHRATARSASAAAGR